MGKNNCTQRSKMKKIYIFLIIFLIFIFAAIVYISIKQDQQDQQNSINNSSFQSNDYCSSFFAQIIGCDLYTGFKSTTIDSAERGLSNLGHQMNSSVKTLAGDSKSFALKNNKI